MILIALAQAQASATLRGQAIASGRVLIERLDRVVDVREGGLVVINDTMTLKAPLDVEGPVLLKELLIGFPYGFKPNLIHSFAYDAFNVSRTFDVRLNVWIGRPGFYSVALELPEGTYLRTGDALNVTIVFAFAGLVSWRGAALNVSFPICPALTFDVEFFSISVKLPALASVIDSSIRFEWADVGDKKVGTHVRSPLKRFSYEPGWISFSLAGVDRFHLIKAREVQREVSLDGWANIFVVERHRLTNEEEETYASWNLLLPKGAFDVAVWDEVSGEKLKITLDGRGVYVVTLIRPLKRGEIGSFKVAYRLPWDAYVRRLSWNDFAFRMALGEGVHSIVDRLIIRISLPHGAKFRNSSMSIAALEGGAIRDVVTFSFHNVTSLHTMELIVAYNYSTIWASYHPTLWMGIIVGIASILIYLWRRPELALIPTRPTIRPEVLRSFVELYEEKARVLSEVELLERRMRSGKIPKKRYKAHRRALEERLSSLSDRLRDLKDQVRAAGPAYADAVRKLELAEAELQEAESGIKRVEGRYERGEITKEAYRRLLEEHESRRKAARSSIEEALIRLKEFIP